MKKALILTLVALFCISASAGTLPGWNWWRGNVDDDGDAVVTGEVKTIPLASFFVLAGLGLIDGVSTGQVAGYNPDIGTTQETLWPLTAGSYSGLYNWLTTPTKLYISSSSASDTGTYEITGLDSNYNVTSEVIKITGQTTKETSCTYFRVNLLHNIGTADNVGIVYLQKGKTVTAGVPDTKTNVVSVMPISESKSLNAIYTVPSGYKLLIFTDFMGGGKDKENSVQFFIRQYGESIFHSTCFSYNYQNNCMISSNVPVVVPEKSDFEFRCNSTSSGSKMSAGCRYLLIDTDAYTTYLGAGL